MRRARFILMIALPLFPTAAFAHIAAVQPGWRGPEPWMLFLALVAVVTYAIGLVSLRHRSLSGRAALDRRARLFGLGWLVLAGPAHSRSRALRA